jgi:mannosyl-3-phosphoglycerate phosphatase family protein
MNSQYLVMTDLDGTLLDHSDYSWSDAQDALGFLAKYKIPVIVNTSKTMAEVKTLVNELKLEHQPYVVENGSAVILPVFSDTPNSKKLFEKLELHGQFKKIGEQHVWVLGKDRQQICDWLYSLRTRHGWMFEGYNDWTVEAVMEKTGLTKSKAIESKQKLFSEPFQWFDSEKNFKTLEFLAKRDGYSILKGGRFYHLQGDVDKSSPLSFFKKYQELLWPESQLLKIIALGDGDNDVAMLDSAEYGICIKSPVNDFPSVVSKNIIFSKLCGPKGWNEEILALSKCIKP